MITEAINNGTYVRKNARLSVCRIDCCTFIVELEGNLLIFDPWLNDPAKFAPFWGSYHEEPLVIRDLPKPDILFISQNAPDHCDFRAIASLPLDTNIVAPPETATRLTKMGFKVQVIRSNESQKCGSLTITVIPGEHPGVLKQNGYLVVGKSLSILVLADPAITPGLLRALKALPECPDALLISSTGFTLRHFGQIVMRPEEAADISASIRARHIFPTRTLMHEGVWGILGKIIVKSFVPPDQSFLRFTTALEKLAPALEVHRLGRGQMWTL